MNAHFVVMGVSGCGKSTVASVLAERTGGFFLDADDFHPPANKAKMADGIPLIDEDRWGWLDALNQELQDAQEPIFLACSALKQVYRDRLSEGLVNLRFIYLQGSKACIGERLSARLNHFMPTNLLESQFATLEEPTDAITVNIEQSLHEIVEEILPQIRTESGFSHPQF